MKSASIFLVLAVITGAARGAQEGGCGRAGALRCDSDGRHLSACTQGGNWWRVRDCGASHASCVDGRCVPQLSSNATRAGECTPSTWGCKDCQSRKFCTAGGNWVDLGNCAEGYVCICGECKSAESYVCGSPFTCSFSAVGKKFPNPLDCTQLYYCRSAWESPILIPCPAGEYFDPCEADCSSESICWINEQCGSSNGCNNNSGHFKFVAGNPSLYYLCVDGLTVFYSCEMGNTFYPTMEMCFTPGVECPSNDGKSKGIKYDDRFSKKHVSYGDCPSSGRNPSGCSPGEKWAFPDDECQYYFCASSTDVRLMTCSMNSKFDATAGNCVISPSSCTKT